MWSWLLRQWATFRSRRRGEMGEKPLVDFEAIELTFERSRVPAVAMLVLLWVVCSVLLILSHQRQSLLVDWVNGQKAPYSIKARVNFSYIDPDSTEKKREEARAKEPDCYRRESHRTREISGNIDNLFQMVAKRAELPDKGRNAAISDSLPARLAWKLSPQLLEALVREYTRGRNYPEFADQLREMLEHGILSDKSDPSQNGVIRVVYSDNSDDNEIVKVNKLPKVATATDKLAQTLFPVDKVCRDEFREVLRQLFGDSGNLLLDHERTVLERENAAKDAPAVKVYMYKDEPLVRVGEVVTDALRERVKAERQAMPKSVWPEAYRLMAWSFILLVAMIFYVCTVSPRIRGDNLSIALSSLSVIIALFFNYQWIRLFNIMQVQCENLAPCVVPAALCAVMLAIMLDIRIAICCGGLVSVITALMIMPDRSLELALRWSAISAAAALLVANVTNYRSFFVRTVGSVYFFTWAVHLDMILDGEVAIARGKLLKEAALLILSNAVFCAMTALVLIFIFELVFNLSTNMALMVLCDCNHPLLERLKREAPGTMAHSMAVATLSEDAARAIGANALRAKAGALFHDIGKLSMPQYFTENNPNSAELHANINPQMSSSVIRDHVKEGLVLARQHRLCRFIRDVISSHHGDDLVKFFYLKAQENRKPGDPPVLESQFRYHGELPYSREAGIVSLADACEAASRSLKSPTPENISELVHKIIDGRLKGGQLRNCQLTAADLDLVAKSFITTLSSSMHGRIAYPRVAGPEDAGEGRPKESKSC